LRAASGVDFIAIFQTTMENGRTEKQTATADDANTAPAGPKSRTRINLSGIATHAVKIDAMTWMRIMCKPFNSIDSAFDRD
jgi:hypothetical protein